MGGEGRRLGGVDKSKLEIAGESCFDRVHRALSASLADIAISQRRTNSNLPLHVISDWPNNGAKSHPALALLGCLSFAKEAGYEQILTSTVDTPFLPPDFAAHMQSSDLSSVAVSGDQIHSLHARWSCQQLPVLKALILGGQHGLYRLHQEVSSAQIKFSTDPIDPFFNINLPEDLEQAAHLAQTYGL